MKRISHYCSLTKDSLYQLAEGLGTHVVDDKIVYLPKEIGKGHIFFTEITPDISAIFFDISFDTPIKFTRLSGSNDLLIFHYDLSQHINVIKINNKFYEIGSSDHLDLAIMDNDLESSFIPASQERTIAIRLVINKNILNDFTKAFLKEKKIAQKKKIKNPTSFYHYGSIDSNSILLIQSVKDKLVSDISFEPLLKGVSLKLLGNFFNKFYNLESKKIKLTEIENEGIKRTKEYLENNLNGSFPSVGFLSAMAGMSDSKYKTLFKKCFNITPNAFFINQKMILAKKHLQSGKYSTITQILYELNYMKLNYFTAKYYKMYKRKPNQDFIKRIGH